MPTLTSYKQSGITPIAIIVIMVLVAAATGGYFLLNKGGISIPGAPGLTLNPNCKYNDPDLCRFINNFKITNSYSAKSTTADKSGKKFETTFEGIGDDKSHIVYSEAGKENFNVITIGDTTYTKDYTDNKWWKQKQPKEEKKLQENIDLKSEIKKTEETPEDKTTYKKIGMEACGSRQCFKYQIINPDLADTTEYIWFDNSEYLLRKERSESKDGTVTDTEINYSGVSINVPSPTKDAKPDQIILPTGGVVPGMTEEQTKELQKATEEMQKASQQAPTVPSTSEENPAPVDTSGENQ